VDADAIEIVRGDDRTVRLAVADSDGQPADLTGWTAVLTVKAVPSAPQPAIRVESVGGPDGLVWFALGHDVTRVPARRYQADVQLTAPDGGVCTPWLGSFTVKQDVTDPGDNTP
jgi:hypothetical protein